MQCVYCKVDPLTTNASICLVPSDGEPDWACVDCAKKHGLYCEKHDVIHMMFMGDNNHACLMCIDDGVADNIGLADEYDRRIRSSIDDAQLEMLDEWIDAVVSNTGVDGKEALLRAIMTTAVRNGITPETVVIAIEKFNRITTILPSQFI